MTTKKPTKADLGALVASLEVSLSEAHDKNGRLTSRIGVLTKELSDLNSEAVSLRTHVREKEEHWVQEYTDIRNLNLRDMYFLRADVKELKHQRTGLILALVFSGMVEVGIRVFGL